MANKVRVGLGGAYPRSKDCLGSITTGVDGRLTSGEENIDVESCVILLGVLVWLSPASDGALHVGMDEGGTDAGAAGKDSSAAAAAVVVEEDEELAVGGGDRDRDRVGSRCALSERA